MRNEIIKKYVDKYSLGVTDIENSLDLYEGYSKNMGFEDTIEQLIEKRLEDRVFVKVLDLGCGNGGFLSDLKKNFKDSVHTIGIDLLAPEKKPDEIVLGDALNSNWPSEVDFIFSFRVLHEIGEPEKIIEKAYNALAQGGKAFLSFRTMDLYIGQDGIAEIGTKEIKSLQKMVKSEKSSSFAVKGFEVSVKDSEGKSKVAGVNIFLEK